MTAAVIQLSTYRARRLLPDHDARMDEGRAIIRDAITRTIVEDYAALPIVTITLAIAEANRVLAMDDGTFADAVEASAAVLRRAMAEQAGSPPRPLLWEMCFFKAARFKVAAAVLRERWTRDHRDPADYHYALCRARRVIDGGGCIQAALYQALGEGGIGGTA